jgi:hypothetical protein
LTFLDNKYTRYYYNIINNAKRRINDLSYETHHIVPESFYINRTRRGHKGWLEGNPESADNKVRLTPREHFICHMLLVKMTTSIAKHKMAKAANRLSAGNDKVKITSRMYAIIKKNLRESMQGSGNPFYQRHHTKATKLAQSSANTGLTRSQKTKDMIRDAKIGDKNPGAKTVTCPHCGVTGRAGGMRKHHFDHCKDHLVYTFKHLTGTTFSGTRRKFIKECLNGSGAGQVSNLIHRRQPSVKGWTLVNN